MIRTLRANIDVHAHFLPPSLVPHARAPGEESLSPIQIGHFESRPVPPALVDLANRFEAMRDTGVDVQVLSGWTELLAYDQPSDIATEFARRHNHALAETVASHPEVTIGLGTVALQDPRAAITVLEEAVRDLGLAGVQIGTHVAGENLGDDRFDPFWAAAEELHAFVLVHPAQSTVIGRERMAHHYFENLLGNPIETTLAGASLIFGGVLERHPQLVVCLAHGGGFLPYQLGRLIHGAKARPGIAASLRQGVEASFRALYFDTILHDAGNLRHLIAVAGADRVLLGSDYPFDMGEEEPVNAVARLPLPASDQDLILGGNASRLFGMLRVG